MTNLRGALLGALGGLLALAGAAHAEGTPLRIGLTPLGEYVASYIAADEGMFARRGLDVSFVPIPANPTIPVGVSAGSLEIGAVNAAVFVLAVDAGLDQVVLSAATRTVPDRAPFGLVVPQDAPFAGAQSLVGKRVLIPGLRSSVDTLFRNWLMDHGVSLDSLNYVEISSLQEASALRAGSADAAVMVEPYLTRAVQNNDARLAVRFAAELPGDVLGTIYIANRSWAAAHPTEVAAFRAALVEAVALAAGHPDIVRAALKKHLNMSDAVLDAVPAPILDLAITPAKLRFWIDTMAREGMLSGKPDPVKMIAP